MTREILTEVGPFPGASNQRTAPPSGWWGEYRDVGLRNLSPTARDVLERDSRALALGCFPGPAAADAWPEGRVRTGLVVGAVQSGKTGSMLAIASLLLDEGTDVLVILAGTRVALWKQTYERLLSQLDGSTPDSAAERWSVRVLVPQPAALLRGDVRSPPNEYMRAAGSKIEDALVARRPVLLVIPKLEAHLLAASRELHARIAAVSATVTRPLHMVVMDDEADDASVLDASDAKTIPRRIEMLWSGKLRGQTVDPRLHATYVAYTATPQANFLQEAHNPLSPRSFCAALRAPFKEGDAKTGPRSATFAEPAGIRSYYCGGELFYNTLRDGGPASFCQATRYPGADEAADEHVHERQVRAAADRMLLDGLRAYLVAAAVRALEAKRSGKWLPSEIPDVFSASQLLRLPPPSCMLVHPSARQDVHFEEARRLSLLSGREDPDYASGHEPTAGEAGPGLDVAELARSLSTEPELWRHWLEAYRSTRSELALWPGASELVLPAADEWNELAEVIRTEVLPRVGIRIINSDPATDDRPEFSPVELPGGSLGPPRDLFTVFVSGNVMSRGITLEGLTTTVFTRPASEPAADTQMQMQRWFGYRGSHVHLCRVLAFDDQLRLFRMYHEHDVAMRNEILASMDRDELKAPRSVLQGPRSLATAKVPSSRLPLHPGPTPSVKLIESDGTEAAAANAAVLSGVMSEGAWVDVGPEARPRGRIRTDAVDPLHVATLLERLRYDAYDPSGSDDPRYTRWRALEDQLGLLPAERPLFRPPQVSGKDVELDPRSCPYSIAAYLRLWAAALKRNRCDGLYPSDTDCTPWALAQPLLREPRFYVAVAYGEAGTSRWPDLARHGVQAMQRGEAPGTPRMLKTLWGRRSEGGAYHGDQLFDYNYTKLQAPKLLIETPLWRERGHPGLLLFHVIRTETNLDAVTVGLAIPHGGPEQFAALPPRGAPNR